MNHTYDVVIIGAGAAGMMCAIEAGKRGRTVLLLDHSAQPGEKIRISGGGRCNFTNIHAQPQNFISQNPKFCISALKRYRPENFIALVKKHNIAYHEKTLGQLFCDQSSRQIIEMLVREGKEAGVIFQLATTIESLIKENDHFIMTTSAGVITAQGVVIASGGLSIPKMGATGFGYQIAKQFDIAMVPTRAGLVPFTIEEPFLSQVKQLAGVSADTEVHYQKQSFKEALLFTHRGISGPAILQISSYWQEENAIEVNFLPHKNVLELLKKARQESPKQEVYTVLNLLLPKRLVQELIKGYDGQKMADISNQKLEQIALQITQWKFYPSGTEGYRTAEVTLGGIDTNELSSQTMES